MTVVMDDDEADEEEDDGGDEEEGVGEDEDEDGKEGDADDTMVKKMRMTRAMQLLMKARLFLWLAVSRWEESQF